ncbi:MAG: LUD domain-containing protein, partial [Carbonactinosporaceae bacterium]
MTSDALRGRERLEPTRADWSAPELPAHRRPLPLLTREALTREETGETAERLTRLSQTWHGPGWSPEMAALRERGAAIRRETLADIEGHLKRLTERLEANGARVHRAGTAEQAVEVVRRIAGGHGVGLAVKSKSMVSEEIHLNAALAADGIEVVETDLGEYIVQLADERPAHIIAPAVHKSRADVHGMFSTLSAADAGEELGQDPEDLTAFARRRLRADFRNADLGISGVNFAAADTGTLVLLTNEGNGRMVTSQPRVHVALMTLEKVIPRLADIGVLVPLLSHAAARQRVSVYQTMLSGPRRPGEADGPEELHVVILDNGRSAIPGTPYEEVLACIRCGACQIACPVYRTLGGGHPYASVYGGPIGAVLSPLIGDRERDADLPFLSSLCGACADVCPVKIPLPDMLVDLRADYERRAARRGPARAPARAAARAGWWLWSQAWSRPPLYVASLAVTRLMRRLVPGPLVARLPGLPRGWARGRALPPVQ